MYLPIPKACKVRNMFILECFIFFRVALEIFVVNGPSFGKLLVELFTDVAPRCCQLFLHLVKGDTNGYAYTGTRIFR